MAMQRLAFSAVRYNTLQLWLVARALTWRRAWNVVLILVSYVASRVRKKPVMLGAPLGAGVEPTTACNLQCPHCVSGLRAFERPTGTMKPELFAKIAEELAPRGLYLTMYFQGEPFINPKLPEMIRKASGLGLYTSASTNGHFLTEEKADAVIRSGLSHLIVSLDGATPETYKEYRVGGDFDTVIEGARTLARRKRALKSLTPLIDLQFVVFRHNEHELKEVKQLGREVGADRTVVKTAQIYDFENADRWLPKDERKSRYRNNDGTTELKKKRYNHCWRLWSSIEITWDGRAAPCCFDKQARYAGGSLKVQALEDVWFRSRELRQFRKKLLNARNKIDICGNCTEGLNFFR